MRRMIRRPTHPGNIIKEDYLLHLAITIKDMADTLGVSRKTLSKKWRYIQEAGKYLRVILLEDGETVHNAVFDRSYKEE